MSILFFVLIFLNYSLLGYCISYRNQRIFKKEKKICNGPYVMSGFNTVECGVYRALVSPLVSARCIISEVHRSRIPSNMSRLRRVDRAILEQNEPIDSQDQELLIVQLAKQNDENLALYSKVLAFAVVVELPILIWLTRTASLKREKLLFTIIITLSSLLSLVNLMYNIDDLGEHLLRRIILRNWSRSFATVSKHIISFNGVAAFNALLLVDLANVARKLGFKHMYCIVPIGNLIMVFLIRKWYSEIKGNVKELDGLRYDYKGV